MFQGLALTFGMLGTQVLSRVARLSFRDAIALTFTFYEGLALSCTTAALLGAVALAGGVTTSALLITAFGLLFLPLSLWRVCVNIAAKRARYSFRARDTGASDGTTEGTKDREGDEEASGSMMIFPSRPRRKVVFPHYHGLYLHGILRCDRTRGYCARHGRPGKEQARRRCTFPHQW